MTERPADEGMPSRLDVELPPDVAGGVFAEFANIWHTKDVFTLDFAAVVNPPQTEIDPDHGTPVLAVPARVVARIRIPPAQVFEIMKALETQLSAWEREQSGGATEET
jgi:hypothetical protein